MEDWPLLVFFAEGKRKTQKTLSRPAILVHSELARPPAEKAEREFIVEIYYE